MQHRFRHAPNVKTCVINLDMHQTLKHASYI